MNNETTTNKQTKNQFLEVDIFFKLKTDKIDSYVSDFCFWGGVGMGGEGWGEGALGLKLYIHMWILF